MSWLSGFFGGSNPTLNSQISGLGQIGATQSGIGATDTSAASTFFQNILAGNTKSIAPQINSIQKQGSEKLKTLSEFGNRSGGTNSEAATTGDKTTASINDFMKSLLAGSANSLASIGSSATNAGLSAYQNQANDSQQQLANWKNSLFGEGITDGAGFLEGKGLGKI
jgi:hypothetical protein